MNSSTGDRLPPQPTLFVGRQDELTEIAHLLSEPDCRLLTLTGAGGIGKTRLALAAAEAAQQTAFPHGVYFVALQPLTSPDFIVSAIAAALNYTFYGELEPKTQLLNYLREKSLLLVLDNFEHLLEGADRLPELLDAASDVKLLITSRERLRLREEWVFDVPGLDFPENGHVTGLKDYTAAQLFVQSARRAGYIAQPADNSAIIRICQLVEGTPLAIELAAAWVRVMPCAAIAREIERSLDILTATTRNLPEKHRSMRAAFEHSWNLLTDPEQTVFRQLSVFRGGFTREAAEAVAGATLAILASLVDKSLLKVQPTGRYDLHELLRQYAAERLEDAGEADAASQRHLDYFVKFAEQVEAHNFGREQIARYDRAELEFDNLRTALTWSIKSETGMRLAAALGWFFNERTHWNEGSEWLERMLAANPNAPAALRAKALQFAGALAYRSHEKQGHARLEQALTLARLTNDRWIAAWSLSWLALILSETDAYQATVYLDESLALFRILGDPMGIMHSLIRRSWLASLQGDYAYERALVEEAGVLAREAGDRIMQGWVSLQFGRMSQRQEGDLRQARTHFESSLSFFREAHFRNGYIRALIQLAEVEQMMGNWGRAQLLFEEALHESAPIHYLLIITLEILALGTMKFEMHFERAATLFGAAHSIERSHSDNLRQKHAEMLYESYRAKLRAELGETAFAKAWAAGNAMTREQAIAYALEGIATYNGSNESEIALPQQAAAQPLANPVTERELEILRLLADGLNTREIAQRLYLSVGTIKWYLKQIYSKLDAHSRVQAIARARALKLLA